MADHCLAEMVGSKRRKRRCGGRRVERVHLVVMRDVKRWTRSIVKSWIVPGQKDVVLVVAF